MNRRGFLGLTLAGAAGMLLDPERLLWVPGKTFVFVKAPVRGVTIAELVAATYDKVIAEHRRTGQLTWNDEQLMRHLAEESYDGIVRL